MKTVYKYALHQSNGWQDVTLPKCADIVHFAADNAGQISIWAEVDISSPHEVRSFCIFGTGHIIPDSAVHTASCIQGPFVWHLYEGAL